MINRLDLHLGNGVRPYQYLVTITPPPAITGRFNISSKIDTLTKRASIPEMKLEQANISVFGRNYRVPFSTEYTQETQMSFYLDEDFTMRNYLEFWMLAIDAHKLMGDNSWIDKLPPSTGSLSGLVDSVENFLSNPVGAIRGLFNSNSANSTNSTTQGGDGVVNTTKQYWNNFVSAFGQTPKLEPGSIEITPLTYNYNPICTYVLHNVMPIDIGAVDFANESVGSIAEFTSTFYYTHFTVSKPSSDIVSSLLNMAGNFIQSSVSVSKPSL